MSTLGPSAVTMVDIPSGLTDVAAASSLWTGSGMDVLSGAFGAGAADPVPPPHPVKAINPARTSNEIFARRMDGAALDKEVALDKEADTDVDTGVLPEGAAPAGIPVDDTACAAAPGVGRRHTIEPRIIILCSRPCP